MSDAVHDLTAHGRVVDVRIGIQCRFVAVDLDQMIGQVYLFLDVGKGRGVLFQRFHTCCDNALFKSICQSGDITVNGRQGSQLKKYLLKNILTIYSIIRKA